MGLLDGKVALIFGVANKNSIAWGITKQMHEHGASVVLSYAGEQLKKRVLPLAEEVNAELVIQCDVSKDEDLDAVYDAVKEKYGKLDTVVHAVAYAKREDMGGRFIDISRDGFKLALDISAYSLIAMAKRAEPLMTEGGSIMSMTYHAAEKVIRDYNAMAVAKAALENITHYLAADMGPQGIRVNSISAGPVKTLASAGVPGFRDLLRNYAHISPLRDNITIEDVGNLGVFLASDMSKMITGEIIYVDSGYNILGMSTPKELLKYDLEELIKMIEQQES